MSVMTGIIDIINGTNLIYIMLKCVIEPNQLNDNNYNNAPLSLSLTPISDDVETLVL